MRGVLVSGPSSYAQKFLDYADVDLDSAAILFRETGQKKNYMYQAAYLANQAGEKYLKAFLIFNLNEKSNKKSLKYIKDFKHNIGRILDECIKVQPRFRDIKAEVEAM